MLLDINDVIEIETTDCRVVEYYVKSINLQTKNYEMVPRFATGKDPGFIGINNTINDQNLSNLKSWRKIKVIKSTITYSLNYKSIYKPGDWLSIRHTGQRTNTVYYFEKENWNFKIPGVLFRLIDPGIKSDRKAYQRGSVFYPQDEILMDNYSGYVNKIPKPVIHTWCDDCKIS